MKTDLDGSQVVYVYDSSGQRVAQIGVSASTATAYLGATEVTDPNTAATATDNLKGTRYYTLGGAMVAVREASATTTSSKLSFLFGNLQGSSQVMVTHAVDGAGVVDLVAAPLVSRNVYTPYGTTRGEATSAENDYLTIDHGWLSQVSDEASTGLVYLNARYYDPSVAMFLSPDPLMNPLDPRTLDPYRYANDDPVGGTDATGMCVQGDYRAYNGGFLDIPCSWVTDEEIDEECSRNGTNCPETTDAQKRCRDYGDCGRSTGQPVQCAWAECGWKPDYSFGEVMRNIWDGLAGDAIHGCFKGEWWGEHVQGCINLAITVLTIAVGGQALKGAWAAARDAKLTAVGVAETAAAGDREFVIGLWTDQKEPYDYITVANQRGSAYFDLGPAWDPVGGPIKNAARVADVIATRTPVYSTVSVSELYEIRLAKLGEVGPNVPLPGDSLLAEWQQLQEAGYTWTGPHTLAPPGG